MIEHGLEFGLLMMAAGAVGMTVVVIMAIMVPGLLKLLLFLAWIGATAFFASIGVEWFAVIVFVVGIILIVWNS